MFSIVPFIAAGSAFAFGALLYFAASKRKQNNLRKKKLKKGWQSGASTAQTGAGLAGFILGSMAQFCITQQAGATPQPLQPLFRLSERKLAPALALAGMQDMPITGIWAWRLRAAVFLLFGGLLFGSAFSLLGMLLFGLVGLVLGWHSVPWALQVRAKERKRGLERHISEAIEVICLGLRSGLSFDRSLELYYQNFESNLSQEFFSAQQLWNTGLQTREAALRDLSRRYDSQIFQRVIDSIVRSLHFGSALSGNLEELARQARLEHRTQVEEAVMKAPVKMMLPIGLLILPSMLLLVMGPVMLELIQGF